MVSTRGIKVKFIEGEKVLCYEPDPTKAKVLYESKVKDVVVNKDTKGKKNVEYLIHFRGWNSSWDRCVSEEFILKDTIENRQLQRDLAEKSKLQFGSYLYRKERKKHPRKSNTAASSEDGSCGSPSAMDEDDQQTTSSEEESSVEDESVPLQLTDYLKQVLESDYYTIMNDNKLHKLPATPTVVTILEIYWKHYANMQKCGLSEKHNSRYRSCYSNGQRIKPEIVHRNIYICQEVLDGLRIYFDFFLPDLLLYNGERGQVEVMQAQQMPLHKMNLELVKNETDVQEYGHSPNMDEDELYLDPNTGQKLPLRRRSLRSYRSVDTNGNGSVHSECSGSKPSYSSVEVVLPTLKIPVWRAVPDYVYSQNPQPPSLIYGATHLVRLLVKLPDLLSSTNLMDAHLKVLLSQMESFMEFLNAQKDWFGDNCYETT